MRVIAGTEGTAGSPDGGGQPASSTIFRTGRLLTAVKAGQQLHPGRRQACRIHAAGRSIMCRIDIHYAEKWLTSPPL
jgi:hypothetical protein